MKMKKMVIEIPEETYQDVVKNGFIYDEDNEVITHAIKHGTLLPEGHGRLGDLDKVADNLKASRDGYDYYEDEYERGMYDGYDYSLDEVMDAPTIIEADTESEGK